MLTNLSSTSMICKHNCRNYSALFKKKKWLKKYNCRSCRNVILKVKKNN